MRPTEHLYHYMDELTTSLFPAWTRFKRGLRTDYRSKLERGVPAVEADVDAPAVVGQVRALARHAEAGTLAFQCVAASAAQALERAAYREHRAAEAALSLAQREKLYHMAGVSAAAAEALRSLLNGQGAMMLRAEPAAEPDPEPSWWFALSEALNVLDEDTAWMRSAVAGQQRGGGAHALGTLAAHLLHEHYRTLLDEAEQWMA